MVEQPEIIAQEDGKLLLFDTVHQRPKHDWAFLGWLLLGVVLAMVFYDMRRWSFDSGPLDLLIPLFSAIVGVVLVRMGRLGPGVQRPLLYISEDRSYITRCSPEGANEVQVSELTHVVFGMIDYPFPERKGIQMEAYALYLAGKDGTPIPVIDACTDKLLTFSVGQALTKALRLPMVEMGKGMNETEPE